MVLLGSEEPRIWTPPLRELTPETSLGFEVINFADQVLGMSLYPWQRWLFIHALELAPGCVASDPEPLFRFDTVVVIVGRQQGKTESIKVKKLWRIYVDGAKTVIATAQDLSNSEKAWAEAVVLAQSTPDLDAEIGHVVLTNGQKSLKLISGNQYRVAATSRRGGRGWSSEDLDLDELREHQSWDSWGAVTPTTLARKRSQVWAWSNAGDAASIVLWFMRAQGMRNAVGVDAEELAAFTDAMPMPEEDDQSDLGDSLALFEWSAHPKTGLWDRQGWAQACPALGHGLVTERKIAGLIRGAPEWTSRNEILCQWRSTKAGGPFPDGAWDAGRDADSRLPDGAPLFACVDVSHDRGMTYVAVAGLREDGHVHVAVTAKRAGTEWVLPWLTSSERPKWAGVTVQSNGAPVSSLVEDLKAELPFFDWSGSELSKGFGQFWDLVRLPKMTDDDDGPADPDKQRVYHWPQPVLDVPAQAAVTRTLSDGGRVVDRVKSPVDAAPLVAAVGAVWLLLRPVEAPKHQPRVHEWPAELLEQMGRW